MPDFLPILVIGIICLIGLLLVFGGGGFIFGPSSTTTRIGLPADRTIEFHSFNVFYTTGEETASHVGGEVSNGIFAVDEKRIGFQVSDIEEVFDSFLKLKVWNANYYGKLVILINEKEVYRDHPPVGEILIGFDNSILERNNILEIGAESSGWRLWAPTVYIFDLDVVVDYTGERAKSFTFDLTDKEKNYLNRARIIVYADREGPGKLDVMVNDVKIYSGVTTIYTDFSTNTLKAGNNTIKFSTEPNTRYEVSSAEIILFFG